MEDDEFFYYLRNKNSKKKMPQRAKGTPFCYLYMKMKWWRNKKTSQKDKNKGFTNFKFQDPYENLNLTNHPWVFLKNDSLLSKSSLLLSFKLSVDSKR